MAIATTIRARDMVRRFSGGSLTVVATRAVLADDAVIHSRGFPESRRVAITAIGLNWEMHRGGSGLCTRAGARVAGFAEHRRAGELAFDVAALAIGKFVSPGEGKAGEIVFEVRSRLTKTHRCDQTLREACRDDDPGPKRVTTIQSFHWLVSSPLPEARPNVAGFHAAEE